MIDLIDISSFTYISYSKVVRSRWIFSKVRFHEMIKFWCFTYSFSLQNSRRMFCPNIWLWSPHNNPHFEFPKSKNPRPEGKFKRFYREKPLLSWKNPRTNLQTIEWRHSLRTNKQSLNLCWAVGTVCSIMTLCICCWTFSRHTDFVVFLTLSHMILSVPATKGSIDSLVGAGFCSSPGWLCI